MRENARQILEIINNSNEHLTAEQIYIRLKENNSKAVLATVYNNLANLYQKGLFVKLPLLDFLIVMTKWKYVTIILFANNAEHFPMLYWKI